MTEMRPGLSLSYIGRRMNRPHSVCREFPCRGPTPACVRAMTAFSQFTGVVGGTSIATAHMKPTSSRAIAVHATVDFLPRAAKAR